MEKLRVLVVDDDDGVRYTLREILETEGLSVDEAKDGQEGLERYLAAPTPLVITDLRMPRLDGMGLLAKLLEQSPAPAVVVVTAHGSERHAVEAMKAGAYDYFRKPFENDELLTVVRRALESLRLRRQNEQLRDELSLSRTMVFASEPMRRLATLAARVAPRNVTVLITGESGTGKERLAEAIVLASPRAEKPFVRFNCASLSADLAESELFGHARGSFTGAVKDRRGVFGEAHGGTLLLDEIGELDPAVQAKLLRVLQTGEARAVGEEKPRVVDVRVIAATHRDLPALVAAGKFREDLFHRLNVVPLRIHPLRERPSDIPVLVRFFLGRLAARFATTLPPLPETLLARLLAHPWPGNVRELENTLERLAALSPDGEWDENLLPETSAPAPAEENQDLRQRVEAYERGLIVECLKLCGQNRSEAARRLSISRVTLHDKLKKYGLGDRD